VVGIPMFPSHSTAPARLLARLPRPLSFRPSSATGATHAQLLSPHPQLRAPTPRAAHRTTPHRHLPPRASEAAPRTTAPPRPARAVRREKQLSRRRTKKQRHTAYIAAFTHDQPWALHRGAFGGLLKMPLLLLVLRFHRWEQKHLLRKRTRSADTKVGSPTAAERGRPQVSRDRCSVPPCARHGTRAEQRHGAARTATAERAGKGQAPALLGRRSEPYGITDGCRPCYFALRNLIPIL